MPAKILVGTCSWTDPTLIECGRFYPRRSMSAAERLSFYAEQFPLVEVDSTFYAPPSERNARLWADRTPSGFVFDVKVFALLTGHGSRPERLPPGIRDAVGPPRGRAANIYLRDLDRDVADQLWETHRHALEPLRTSGRLGALLFQFAPWFHRDREHVRFIADLPARLPGLRIAVEFRGGGWMTPDAAPTTLALLERHGLTYVSVDEPQGFRTSTPPVAAATSSLAYVRLHGRNSATWEARTPTAADRFNYLYTEEELREWVPRVHELAHDADTVHVLFNNNYQDVGVRNARQMALLLSSD